ncbi:Hypothetical protein PP7435_CHR3-1688 [Komagataella phaffii CBS 7435]|uniref:Uncharacterized protein n=1 Tax=Komagataella phaffii (strain ATCC 76273 / CBS 7435 / CECT 11047 / NRRL Y-11430 / Wegner 21-1) TaxID=981350 RepID=A0A1G4KQA8_KOMPC|nr:Hypothetical protein BQ9382_C3-1698 [Komagataella phaffii CBS 7435]SCV12183.1 Hypothetical protein PP7435_CHR3-1688 [Komagataella phaffii CBS 7435]
MLENIRDYLIGSGTYFDLTFSCLGSHDRLCNQEYGQRETDLAVKSPREATDQWMRIDKEKPFFFISHPSCPIKCLPATLERNHACLTFGLSPKISLLPTQ